MTHLDPSYPLRKVADLPIFTMVVMPSTLIPVTFNRTVPVWTFPGALA